MNNNNENYNCIGDTAGYFDTAKALVAQMPQDAINLFHGDLNDRGPKSKQMIEEVMKGIWKATNSNHGHMFVDYYLTKTNPKHKPYYGDTSTFLGNGGDTTLLSYGIISIHDDITKFVPKEHIEFLKNLPLAILTDNFMFSHAPLIQNKTVEEASDLGKSWDGKDYYKAESSLIWNRLVPTRPHSDLGGRINIFGHNPSDEVKIYSPQYPAGLKVIGIQLNCKSKYLMKIQIIKFMLSLLTPARQEC